MELVVTYVNIVVIIGKLEDLWVLWYMLLILVTEFLLHDINGQGYNLLLT